MKNTVLLLIFLFSTGMANAQSRQEHQVDKALEQVIRDILALSVAGKISEIDEKYIHPEFGVYDVFRIGIPDRFEQHGSIGFAFPKEENSLMIPSLNDLTTASISPKIVTHNATYDCNEMIWDREGVFVTDSISYPKLSEIAKRLVYEEVDLPKTVHEQAKYIEKNSCRVVLTEIDIIFYLTKIDGNWYLTLFDRVTTDCGA